MSFADYTSVKTAAVVDWMHRSDLTSQADDFMDLFESDFNSSMRVRQMEAQTSSVATTGYITHPSNWLGWKKLTATVGSNTYALEPASDEIAIDRTYSESGGATPRYYKVLGSKTYLFPVNSAVTIAGTYYEGVALSSGANWLLTAYPGAYLYGMLIQCAAYVGDNESLVKWTQAYEIVVNRIKQDSKKGEWSGQALRMQPDVRVV
jgi:hypothetical protein